jgi:NADH:ubiquinone oxidoreductase subunit 6 (subunit J)
MISFPLALMACSLLLIIFSGAISSKLKASSVKYVNIPFYNSIILYFAVALFSVNLGVFLGMNSTCASSSELTFEFAPFFAMASKILLFILAIIIAVLFGIIVTDGEAEQLKNYDPQIWKLVIAGFVSGILGSIAELVYLTYDLRKEIEDFTTRFQESEKLRREEKQELEIEKTKEQREKLRRQLEEVNLKIADLER